MQYNLLVLSDLHLGEALRPGSTEVDTRDLALAEQQLCAFVRYHQNRRRQGRSWRLVINGDMLDFLAVVVGVGRYGDTRTTEASVKKLAQIMTAHSSFVKALAEFVAAGNRVEIIAGNHDTEFQMRPVQQAFVEHIASTGIVGPAIASSSITFHDWFFLEPGVAWIEHGHMYDDSCSLPHSLVTLQPNTNSIFENIDTAGMRYMTNQIANLDPSITESWTALGFLRFAMNSGLRGGLRVAWQYAKFARSLFRSYRGLQRCDRKALQRQQDDALEQLITERELDAESIKKIEAMTVKPAVAQRWRLAQILMLDKVMVSVAAAITSIALLALMPILWGLLASGVVIVGGSMLLNYFDKKRDMTAAEHMAKVATEIGKIADVRVVSFGHTHQPVHQVEAGVAYVNSGTWMPSEHPGLLRTFVYTEILAGADVTLRRWEGSRSKVLVAPTYIEAPSKVPKRQTTQAPADVQQAA